MFRQSRAIHSDEWFSCTRRPIVNFLREQILSSAALAPNQIRRIRSRDACGKVENAPYLRGGAAHAPKFAFGNKLSAQPRVIRFQLREAHEIRDTLTKLGNVKSLDHIIVCSAAQRLDRSLRGVQRGKDHNRPVETFVANPAEE